MEERRQPLSELPPLSESPRVSVIVPALNEERYIERCLRGFVGQDYPASLLQVIVAEAGSSDRTRELAEEVSREAAIEIRLVDNPGRSTPSGFNSGLAVAKGEVVVNFIAHAEPAPDFVRANVEALRTTNAAAVGGPIETRGSERFGRAIAAAVSHPFGVGDAKFRYSYEAGYVDTIAFAAYRRECFDVLGGFSTNRVLAEDDFFNFEVRSAGGQLFLTPEVRSIYYSRSTLRSLARQYFGYGRAKGRAMVEERSSIRPRHLVPAGTLVVGGALALLSPFLAGARVALAGGALIYATLGGLSGIRAARRQESLADSPLIALVFPILHACYGTGTLVGSSAAVGRSLLRRS